MWDIWCFQEFCYILLWRSFWGFLSECFPCQFIWLRFLLCSLPQNLVVINGSNWEEAKRTQAFDQSVRCLAACLLACRLISSISKVASLLCFPILDNRIHELTFRMFPADAAYKFARLQSGACPAHLLRLLPPSIMLLILPPPHIAPHITPIAQIARSVLDWMIGPIGQASERAISLLQIGLKHGLFLVQEEKSKSIIFCHGTNLIFIKINIIIDVLLLIIIITVNVITLNIRPTRVR